MPAIDQALDMANASDAELADFAQRHGVQVERLLHCREYLRASPPMHTRFELVALLAAPRADAEPTLVLRLMREGVRIELPADLPLEHLRVLVELLDGLR